MNDFDFVETFNFMKNTLSNHIKVMDNGCVKESLGRKMLTAGTIHIGAMSIMEWATKDENCRPVA